MKWIRGFPAIRNSLIRFNHRIERKLGPRQVNLIESYRTTLCSIAFSHAIHLGCGRDEHQVRSRICGRAEVVSLDEDFEGLKENDAPLRIGGDASALPFKNGTFDMVFSEYAFEHILDPWIALKEVDRVLAPGGSVLILVPNRKHYYAWLARLTPLWFHRLWLRWRSGSSAHIDTFPKRYRWGAVTDFHSLTQRLPWQVVAIDSMPGQSYTHWLPFHVLFVILDRILSRWQSMHVSYVVHFRKLT